MPTLAISIYFFAKLYYKKGRTLSERGFFWQREKMKKKYHLIEQTNITNEPREKRFGHV